MALPVLERVERTHVRRRQVRRRRATALLVVVTLGAGAGWLVSPHGGDARPVKAAPRPAVREPEPILAARPAPLLSGPPQLQSHRFTPPLTSRSAILVDVQSGRVLYELRTRVRRPIASTTKIMTALVALKRVSPAELITVDRTVPRVPLVKEGLRSGERVKA